MDSRIIARIVADNDQDRENAKKWWREASNDDKVRVWETIQRNFDEPEMEIMSRFAALGFADLLCALENPSEQDPMQEG